MRRPEQPALWGIRSFLALAIVAVGAAVVPAAAPPPRPSGLNLDGGVDWINTTGPIRLEELRGKVVLLDFWNCSRVNCRNVLPDLAKLDEKYRNELVIVGVHSPRFFAERDTETIRRKVREYGINYPVVNDGDQVIWRRFNVETWPTLVLLDVDGSYINTFSNDGHYTLIDRAIGPLVTRAKRRKILNDTPLKFFAESVKPDDTPLLFPGKVLADVASRRLFIADTAHNRLVLSDLQGKNARPIGGGVAGLVDGPYDRARFNHPQGIWLAGDTLYVADTENHAIRAVDLRARTVSTVAGTGQPSRRHTGAGPARTTSLSSPWAVMLHPEARALLIAMAGAHQIWRLDLESDIIGVWAGTGAENRVDGPLNLAAFAQPSGLATDGTHVFVADSESSSVRSISLDKRNQRVQTLIGQGLPFFDDIDGFGDEVRLQRCLGVAYGEGKLYIADSYNNKIKLCDPRTRAVETLVGARQAGDSDSPPRLFQPGGLSMAHPHLYVADTNNHKIRVVDLKEKTVQTLALDGLKPPAPVHTTPAFPNSLALSVPEATVRPGALITLDVTLPLEKGVKANPDAPMPYLIETPGKTGLLSDQISATGGTVSHPSQKLTIGVPLAKPVAAGDTFALKLSLESFVCNEGSNLYHVQSYVWTVPVRVASTGSSHITLTGSAN